jgi:hypothetical protein
MLVFSIGIVNCVRGAEEGWGPQTNTGQFFYIATFGIAFYQAILSTVLTMPYATIPISIHFKLA